MQVNATNGTSGTNAAATAQPKNELGKEAFLQLLVAQVKNQNPMNPTDGVQFLSQLTQFTQVEQLIGIREDLSTLIERTQAGTSGAKQ